MPNTALGGLSGRETPQNEQAPGTVANNAGGYVFAVDDWTRLERFLVLGVDGGTYYVGARTLAKDNDAVVRRCLDADPERTVRTIVRMADGRAPKMDPALYALAVASAHPDSKQYALAALPLVARTGTHLFHFVSFMEAQRGWGRGARSRVAQWYEHKSADQVAYQAVKYQQRDGWSHRDILRLAHPKATTPQHAAVYEWIVGRTDGQTLAATMPRIIEGFAKMHAEGVTPAVAAGLIGDYNLPWETVPSELLKSPDVWTALVESNSLPLTAMIRNLGTMTARGVISPVGGLTNTIVGRITNEDTLRKARIHPYNVLVALKTYAGGTSRGGRGWTPVTQVTDALDAAFYKSFGTIEPANKRTLIGLDVSGSMSWTSIANSPLTAREGACAMAMATVASEPQVVSMAFAGGFRPVDLSPRRRLDDIIRQTERMGMDRTDCSLPMIWAQQNRAQIDTFVVYTDSETWAGRIHPFEALRRYRESQGIDARLVVVGMTATRFSIADPSDAGMLDVVGFDSAAPGIISGFSAGRF